MENNGIYLSCAPNLMQFCKCDNLQLNVLAKGVKCKSCFMLAQISADKLLKMNYEFQTKQGVGWESCLMTPQASADRFVNIYHFSCEHGW